MEAIHPFPRLARLTLEKHLAGRPVDDSLLKEIEAPADLWRPRRACFVSIKTLGGGLRGCVGTVFPVQGDLAREIMANAISAATRDPRFPPLRPREMGEVSFSVDVLSPPEPVDSPAELNPACWGVIVSRGEQRGLLLPDLEGVETVDQQLAIAARKAGLSSLKGVSLQRFSVDRYREDGPA
ncbi:MAG: AmmeMemoRadiSam system protein A [Candidatus Adiutrix sp.]|jgi:AmmeMemoRadiSam system protein A|nr:AmmeMemoRadiSam system protein A [Candidatus Adiutrix sp.]